MAMYNHPVLKRTRPREGIVVTCTHMNWNTTLEPFGPGPCWGRWSSEEPFALSCCLRISRKYKLCSDCTWLSPEMAAHRGTVRVASQLKASFTIP